MRRAASMINLLQFQGIAKANSMTNLRPDARAAGSFTLGGDLHIYRLGYGAMRITGPGIWGPPADPAGAKAVLRRAVALGINFIDTADSYGPHVSEELIAEALHPYPGDLVIATKGGFMRDGPDQWRPNGRPEHLRAALDGSLKRLKLERIDLYQLHRIDPDVPLAESLGALIDMQAQGKIRHIGLSEVNVAELEQAQRITPIVSIQNRYNLTDRGSEAILERCARDQLGFIPWFPLAVGSLARARSGLGGFVRKLGIRSAGRSADQALYDIARQRGATPAQVALAWLLQRSPVMLPIPGTASIAHLEENTAAATLQLTADELRALAA